MHKLSRSLCIHICATLIALSLLIVSVRPAKAQSSPPTSVHESHTQIHALKVTLLSPMLVGRVTGLGEGGFSPLIEADGNRILLDTGARPANVLQNARALQISFPQY